MMNKKTVAFLFSLIFLGTAAAYGYIYYLDHIKLPPVSPEKVVTQYFDCLKNHNYKQAYQMVSRQYYKDSYNQFLDRVGMYSSQMKIDVQRVNLEKEKATVTMRITVPLEFGPYTSETSMELSRDKREWKIMYP